MLLCTICSLFLSNASLCCICCCIVTVAAAVCYQCCCCSCIVSALVISLAATFAGHSAGLLHFAFAFTPLAVCSLVLFQVMAPLLDTNHELSWHANMVDAIEQKAANQRTEGGSTTTMHAMSALLPFSGSHCAHNDACCAGSCLQICQRQYTSCMLDNAVCLPWAYFVFGLSIVHLRYYKLTMQMPRLQMLSRFTASMARLQMQWAAPCPSSTVNASLHD